MPERKFVAVDVETGGLDPRKNPLIEVGLVIEPDKDDPSGWVREVEFSLPFSTAACTSKALEVNGWDGKQGRKLFPEQWDPEPASRFLLTEINDVHLVGKNPQFDAAFLLRLIERYHGPIGPPWHHRMVDVGTLAWGWYNGRDSVLFQSHPPNTPLTEEILGVPLDGQRHSALDDARWAYNAFRKVVPA